MRKFVATILCCLLLGLPLAAQSPTQNPQAPSSQQPAQATQAPGQASDPDEPVLKRRTPAERTGETQEQSQPSQAPQASQTPTGPVLQQRQPPPNTIPMARTVPVNTQFHATLDRTLSTKSTRSGDPFTVTLTEPLRNQQGEVLLPAGTHISGVVQDSESGKIFASMRGKGKLALRFQDVQLSNGQTLPIQATLLGIVEKKSGAKTNDEGQVTGGGPSGKTTGKDVGIGAGVGTIAGLIFGSALKGAAIGAIAGGGYVLANAGKDVELPANTTLNLRLDQLLTVPQ